MFKNLVSLPIFLCLLSLPTLVQANTVNHTSLSTNFDEAKRVALSLKKSSTAAEGLAAVGNISQANVLLEKSLLASEQSRLERHTLATPQSLHFLHLMIPILEKTFFIEPKVIASLGPSLIAKMKYQHYLHLIKKTNSLFEAIDTQTYLPLMDECEEVHCPDLELIEDQFFSAQKSMIFSFISFGTELHQTFYDSRIEINFQVALIKELKSFLSESYFQHGWACVHKPITLLEDKIIHIARAPLNLSASERADRISRQIQSLKQILLTIQNRDSCHDLEK